eukprot:11663524-Prorocentrum_lima.AAC.1
MVDGLARGRRKSTAARPARRNPAAQQVPSGSRVRCDLAQPAGQGADAGTRDCTRAAPSGAFAPDVEAASARHQRPRQ